jgi:hypothetical protein
MDITVAMDTHTTIAAMPVAPRVKAMSTVRAVLMAVESWETTLMTIIREEGIPGGMGRTTTAAPGGKGQETTAVPGGIITKAGIINNTVQVLS